MEFDFEDSSNSWTLADYLAKAKWRKKAITISSCGVLLMASLALFHLLIKSIDVMWYVLLRKLSLI